MRAPTAALVGAALVALAGCGSDLASTATTTVTETESLAPEQQELTESQITRALPDEDDVPDNFASDPGGQDPNEEDDGTTDPEACLAVELNTPAMRDFRDEHRRVARASRFSDQTGGLGLGILTVNLWTFDTPYPREHLDEAGSAVADCTKYSMISAKGDKTGPWLAKTTPIPLLGDQSLGIRVGDPEHDLAIDHLWVVSGHNLLQVSMVSSYRENNEGLLEDTAQDVLDGLGR